MIDSRGRRGFGRWTGSGGRVRRVTTGGRTRAVERKGSRENGRALRARGIESNRERVWNGNVRSVFELRSLLFGPRDVVSDDDARLERFYSLRRPDSVNSIEIVHVRLDRACAKKRCFSRAGKKFPRHSTDVSVNSLWRGTAEFCPEKYDNHVTGCTKLSITMSVIYNYLVSRNL